MQAKPLNDTSHVPASNSRSKYKLFLRMKLGQRPSFKTTIPVQQQCQETIQFPPSRMKLGQRLKMVSSMHQCQAQSLNICVQEGSESVIHNEVWTEAHLHKCNVGATNQITPHDIRNEVQRQTSSPASNEKSLAQHPSGRQS